MYSWIWSPGCTDNFLILKEKQCLRNLFYCFQFYLENDKVKAHVGTSSPWALIWKWNVNFRWICVHPPQAFISHIKSTFFLSIMFLLPSLFPLNILWCCQHRWKQSWHRWKGDGIHVLSVHEPKPVPAWTQALNKHQIAKCLTPGQLDLCSLIWWHFTST